MFGVLILGGRHPKYHFLADSTLYAYKEGHRTRDLQSQHKKAPLIPILAVHDTKNAKTIIFDRFDTLFNQIAGTS